MGSEAKFVPFPKMGDFQEKRCQNMAHRLATLVEHRFRRPIQNVSQMNRNQRSNTADQDSPTSDHWKANISIEISVA